MFSGPEEELNYYIDLLKQCYKSAAMTSSDYSNTNAAMLITAEGVIEPVSNKLPEGVVKTDERTKIRPK